MILKMQLSAIFILAAAVSACSAARILAIMPMPTRSHANLVDSLVEELGRRGHQVTYLSAMKMEQPGKNVQYIFLPSISEFMTSMQSQMNTFSMRKYMMVSMFFTFPYLAVTMNRIFLNEPEVQKLIQSDEKYDLVLGEAFMDEALLAGLTHKFKAPLAVLSPTHMNVWANVMTSNPAPAASIPDPTLPLTNSMSFWERVLNTVYGTLFEIIHTTVTLRMQDSLMREFFGDDLPPLRSIIGNVSLVLVNQHYSLSFPRPYLPNVVEIGGYHVKPPKPLPKDLKKYFDEAEHGVILFSLGSHVKSSQMSKDRIDSLLAAFSQLKQNVLWKFDSELENLPKNVNISKWLPQSDILAHPNLKLFITHGGLLSTTEAIHRGVPLVGIPVLGDQPANMRLVEHVGSGRTLEYEDITVHSVLEKVNEVLNNPKYKETAQFRSQLLKDTPMPPMETAMYWIEYVLRHKGAPHLRSAAQDLAWYQLYLLDVYAVLAIFAAVSLTLQFYIARCLYRKLRGSKCKKNAKSDKKTK